MPRKTHKCAAVGCRKQMVPASMVEQAYREGWNAGVNYIHPQTEDDMWLNSEAYGSLHSDF